MCRQSWHRVSGHGEWKWIGGDEYGRVCDGKGGCVRGWEGV